MAEKKKYYTPSELFDIINKRLKEKDLLPEHLEYSLGDRYTDVEYVKYISWDTICETNFGGSEGIYLDVYLVGYIDEWTKCKRVPIGTYKTLEIDKEPFRDMSNIGVEFVFEMLDFVRNHTDNFD